MEARQSNARMQIELTIKGEEWLHDKTLEAISKVLPMPRNAIVRDIRVDRHGKKFVTSVFLVTLQKAKG